nr:MAG TPA: hypothetical protein [Caudoviricetes sp.]
MLTMPFILFSSCLAAWCFAFRFPFVSLHL